MSAATLSVFAEVGPDHPFAEQVQPWRDSVARHTPTDPGARTVRSSELKGRRTATGFTLVRAYCSVQTWHPCPDVPFSASTLNWAAGSEATWSDLAHDPYLGDLRGWLRAPVEVLRYVPTRRFTVASGGVVTKVKRRSRLLDSALRVAAVSAGLASSSTDVRAPALLAVDVAGGTYRQRLVTGPAMSQLCEPAGASIPDLMAEAGRVHAAFHATPVPDLPAGGQIVGQISAVRLHADWVGLFRPDLADRLTGTARLLEATAPAEELDATATCHGDLVPSHLLADGRGWTVIDLDLAHVGDRYRDIALFLAGLPGDLPMLTDGGLAAAEQAFLGGYRRQCGRPLDERRLGWHRAAAEMRQLALMYSKDTMQPGAVDRILGTLDAATLDLRTST